ncbi:bifunctional phosphatase PAP2/diacylglycerol kinase family protein [Actinoallomurus soli]|uniref:bifunctional phosphatase PAP2/diacylglycerol kinase family protein n=1 Tax=Actinoallomurus soli TaxID=2952535 RepID=UPI002091EBDB|nr:bifunctional phosphatase PAP2/diacylglycerol kinase family protein [Actinoallomurus soli]MCO5974671.1 phosphatase PAP2 family protein [Actinoallomurus soli]
MSLLNRARELDQRAFDAVAAAKLPGLEYVLPRLSRIANHSVLWGGVAGSLALTRQPRMRRAALRGAIALGLASPLANLVGKQAFRRPRPLIELFTPSARPRVTRTGVTLIPSIRSPWRLPTSPSFPSGHSASAAAFATAVAMEAPAAVAVPVGVTAATVAFSRIYTGAHYPGDVLAGIALGTVAGLGTRLLWPTMPGPASSRWTKPVEAVRGLSEDGEGVVVVVNPGAGANSGGRDVTRVLKERLPAAEIIEADGDLETTLKDAAGRAAVLGACGGDGTIRAAAAAALDQRVPLLVIPGGTLNHFARALGIETAAQAIAAYRSGCIARVDVGRAGDEIFLNTASFGAYTELVQRRERLEGRLGKWPALAVAAVRVLRHSEPADVYVDGRRRRVWFAFIGNCRYGARGVTPTWRGRLDDGVLDVRLIGAKRHISRTRAVAALLIGHLRLVPDYSTWSAGKLELEGAHGALRLTRDGEVGDAEEGTVTVTKAPAALAVFVPSATAAASAQTTTGRLH